MGVSSSMKHTILGTLALATAFAAPLEQGERDRAMSHLHATRKVFLDAIAGLSDAQWNFKPAADRWSIAECSEHIAVSDDSLFELLQQVVKSPASPEKKSVVKDEYILRVLTDRSVKAKAPEFLQPKRRWPDRDTLIAHFKQSRDRNIVYIQTTEDDRRLPGDAAALSALRAPYRPDRRSEGRSTLSEVILELSGTDHRFLWSV